MEKIGLIPEDIKRFILNSIDSVPHLETILLLYREPDIEWDAKRMAQNLYLTEKKAAEILAHLFSCGFAAIREGEVLVYRYQPHTAELEKIVGQLTKIYADNLIEITNLIHYKTINQAKEFGNSLQIEK